MNQRILDRVTGAIREIGDVLRQYGTEGAREKLEAVERDMRALADEITTGLQPPDLASLCDPLGIASGFACAVSGGGHHGDDSRIVIASAAPNTIGREADADGMGQFFGGTHPAPAHPSAPNSETPAAQRQVQPAGHSVHAPLMKSAGGRPIPETPPRAAGGGQGTCDTHTAGSSPLPIPANDGGARGHRLRVNQTQGAARNLPASAGGAGHTTADTPVVIARPKSSRAPLSAITAVAKQTARSILDSHRMPNGKPYGDCTYEDLVQIKLGTQERIKTDLVHLRLAEFAMSNMPPNGRVRDHLNERKAERALRFASQPAPKLLPPTVDLTPPKDYAHV